MRKLLAALLLALLPATALAQQFPVVPDGTVIGRIGTGSSSGPAQAIPFATVFNNLGGLRVGSTSVGSGTNGFVLYNNSGLLGQYGISGTGSVAMTNGPTFTTQITTPVIASNSGLNFFTSTTNTAGGITPGGQWIIEPNPGVGTAGALLTVSHNTATLPAIPGPFGSPELSLGSADGSGRSVLSMQAFATAGGEPSLLLFGARGTAAAPTQSKSGDFIGEIGFHPYGLTGGYVYSGGAVLISAVTEDCQVSSCGQNLQLFMPPTGTAVAALAMTFQASGGLSVGTTTDGGIGSLLANTSIKSKGPTSGIGYATGAGGAVTQATSRATGVTLNNVTGAITLVSAAGSATPNSFTLTNSVIAATDVVKVVQKSGTDLYEIFVTAVAAGSCKITFFTTGGTTTEQPVFNFVVIKGVSS